MKMTYVIGHKKPDTDSVCASISYSYLKNKLGWTTEPRVLGNINKETKFLVVGLGLLGGSYAMGLKQEGYTLCAIDDDTIPVQHVSYDSEGTE